MDVDSIRKHCLSYPRATEKLPWGDDLCFKVGGKIFAILDLVCFKCTPEMFAELVEREDIRPAPYLGRYRWVMLDRPDALGEGELQDLIGQELRGGDGAGQEQQARYSAGPRE
jgi:predicted DNA-binding protein (MmcQ/YjbR family)